MSAQKTLFVALLLISPLTACQHAATENSTPSPVQVESGCGDDGTFEVTLFGSIEAAVTCLGSDMMYENMQRPNDEGGRLRFSGLAGGKVNGIRLSRYLNCHSATFKLGQ